MFVIYIDPHTTGSCPGSTDQTSADLLPAVTALSAILFAVILLLAVAIVIIALQYTMLSRKAFVNCLEIEGLVDDIEVAGVNTSIANVRRHLIVS